MLPYLLYISARQERLEILFNGVKLRGMEMCGS
jgi:hypothetical protein